MSFTVKRQSIVLNDWEQRGDNHSSLANNINEKRWCFIFIKEGIKSISSTILHFAVRINSINSDSVRVQLFWITYFVSPQLLAIPILNDPCLSQEVTRGRDLFTPSSKTWLQSDGQSPPLFKFGLLKSKFPWQKGI